MVHVIGIAGVTCIIDVIVTIADITCVIIIIIAYVIDGIGAILEEDNVIVIINFIFLKEKFLIYH